MKDTNRFWGEKVKRSRSHIGSPQIHFRMIGLCMCIQVSYMYSVSLREDPTDFGVKRSKVMVTGDC